MVFDVLRRADCEYVPASVIERVHGVKVNYLYDVLHTLCKKGVLESKKGGHGGYKHVKSVSVYALFQWLAPKSTPDARHVEDPVFSNHMALTADFMRGLIIKPRKMIPRDYPVEDALNI
jgi:hypothetical protein